MRRIPYSSEVSCALLQKPGACLLELEARSGPIRLSQFGTISDHRFPCLESGALNCTATGRDQMVDRRRERVLNVIWSNVKELRFEWCIMRAPNHNSNFDPQELPSIGAVAMPQYAQRPWCVGFVVQQHS
jgi:hypothetical protein